MHLTYRPRVRHTTQDAGTEPDPSGPVVGSSHARIDICIRLRVTCCSKERPSSLSADAVRGAVAVMRPVVLQLASQPKSFRENSRICDGDLETSLSMFQALGSGRGCAGVRCCRPIKGVKLGRRETGGMCGVFLRTGEGGGVRHAGEWDCAGFSVVGRGVACERGWS